MERTALVIIGSGPAGLTAAIYAARADLAPVVFEGIEPGGQLTKTTEVENYPGFPDGIMGPELMDKFKEQAERFGAKFIQDIVVDVDLSERPFKVTYDEDDVIIADAIIIATGASARWLGLESEEALKGRGVSACATCDGFFFRDKKVAVIGGGDTALEDALFLTRFASEVLVIHRRDELRASKYMQERGFNNPKITFVWDSVPEDILGDESTGVTGIRLQNVKTGAITDIELNGVFVAIGHHPNTEFLKGQLPVDNTGFLKVKHGTSETEVPGVFASGDVKDPKYKQAITAAGFGCMAALEAQEFLEMNPLD